MKKKKLIVRYRSARRRCTYEYNNIIISYFYLYTRVRVHTTYRIRVHFVRPINNHHQMAHGAAAVAIGCFINENNVGWLRVAHYMRVRCV